MLRGRRADGEQTVVNKVAQTWNRKEQVDEESNTGQASHAGMCVAPNRKSLSSHMIRLPLLQQLRPA